jgi:cystathionine beta-lyase
VVVTSAHPFDGRTRLQLDVASSRKWSLHPGTIGAWVAEMDFGTAPVVTEALHRAIRDENLGYLAPSVAAALGDAVAGWLSRTQGWAVDPTRVHPVSDVMAALAVAVQRFSPAGSAVIVPTPAYMPFLTYLPSLGHPVVEVPGMLDADGRWSHDLDAIDAAFAAGARTLVLCNPHNPTGTVATRAELEQLEAVVTRHGGRVFSDEIHAPLIYRAGAHIPYASISRAAASHTITGISASKAWNIPGLKAAALITSNDEDEAQYRRFGFASVHGASTLGVVAATAAFTSGGPWLDDTVAYLRANRDALGELLRSELPQVRFRAPDATYLAWIDASGAVPAGRPAGVFRERAGVTLTDGSLCGVGYEGWVRFVFAMPRPLLEEAVHRMGRAVRGDAY